MVGLRQLTVVNFKLFLREPIATFFALAFPPMLVLLFGAIYGNEAQDIFGGYGSMDISLPGYIGLILATTGFLGVPITLCSYREIGVLRRYRATPLRPLTFILADVLNNLAVTLLGMVILALVGRLLYDVRFEGQILPFILAVILGALTMFSLGYLIASLVPTARVAQVISLVIFYPMMFLSGAAIPLELMPDSILRVSHFLPMTYVVDLLRGLWFGGRWADYLTETAVMLAVLLLCAALASRFFRWE